MKARTSRIDERFLLAPSRLVNDYPLRNGYDMGIAVTAGSLDFDFPDFALSDAELDALEHALAAVEQGHSAYYWRPILTYEEAMALDRGEAPVKTTRQHLRENQERIKEIRLAVAAGDLWLPLLVRHHMVLTVTTRKEEFAPVPASFAPKYPFSAIVAVRSIEES